MRTVRVRIVETVNVDIDAWSLTYGTEATAAEVREDVKRHAHSVLMEGYTMNDEFGGGGL